MARKIKAAITHPIYDADGQVIFQPGTHLDEHDPRLEGMASGTFRYVIVDEPAPEPAPAPKATSKATTQKGSGV